MSPTTAAGGRLDPDRVGSAGYGLWNARAAAVRHRSAASRMRRVVAGAGQQPHAPVQRGDERPDQAGLADSGSPRSGQVDDVPAVGQRRGRCTGAEPGRDDRRAVQLGGPPEPQFLDQPRGKGRRGVPVDGPSTRGDGVLDAGPARAACPFPCASTRAGPPRRECRLPASPHRGWPRRRSGPRRPRRTRSPRAGLGAGRAGPRCSRGRPRPEARRRTGGRRPAGRAGPGRARSRRPL